MLKNIFINICFRTTFIYLMIRAEHKIFHKTPHQHKYK